MNPVVERALEAAFPDRKISEVTGTGPSWNDSNETVRVRFEAGADAYLKVALDGDGTRVLRERAVTAYVREHTDVPTPDVTTVALDADPPYLVTAPVEGESLLDRWGAAETPARRALASGVGAALGRLHRLSFTGHGRFMGGDADTLEFEPRPWFDLLVADIEYMCAAAPSPRFPDYYDDLLAAVSANSDRLRNVPAVLLHGDPARPTTVIEDGQVGFLDWERAHAGDPVRELCRARAQQFEFLYWPAEAGVLDAFHDGYRSVAGTLPDGYQERRPIYLLSRRESRRVRRE